MRLFGDNFGEHFGGNLTEENYNYNLKYKSMKKNYSKPVMVLDLFTPNEYVAACYKWELKLLCTGGSTDGMHYVFPAEGAEAVGTVYHSSHEMTYYLKL